jgi:hypothetical protein
MVLNTGPIKLAIMAGLLLYVFVKNIPNLLAAADMVKGIKKQKPIQEPIYPEYDVERATLNEEAFEALCGILEHDLEQKANTS